MGSLAVVTLDNRGLLGTFGVQFKGARNVLTAQFGLLQTLQKVRGR